MPKSLTDPELEMLSASCAIAATESRNGLPIVHAPAGMVLDLIAEVRALRESRESAARVIADQTRALAVLRETVDLARELRQRSDFGARLQSGVLQCHVCHAVFHDDVPPEERPHDPVCAVLRFDRATKGRPDAA